MIDGPFTSEEEARIRDLIRAELPGAMLLVALPADLDLTEIHRSVARALERSQRPAGEGFSFSPSRPKPLGEACE